MPTKQPQYNWGNVTLHVNSSASDFTSEIDMALITQTQLEEKTETMRLDEHLAPLKRYLPPSQYRRYLNDIAINDVSVRALKIYYLILYALQNGQTSIDITV